MDTQLVEVVTIPDAFIEALAIKEQRDFIVMLRKYICGCKRCKAEAEEYGYFYGFSRIPLGNTVFVLAMIEINAHDVIEAELNMDTYSDYDSPVKDDLER